MVKVLMWTKGHELVLPTPPDEARLPYRMTMMVPRRQGATKWCVLQRCTRWNEEAGHTVHKDFFSCISDPVGRQQQVMVLVANKWMYHDKDGDLRKSAAVWRIKNPEQPLSLEEQRTDSRGGGEAAADKAAARPTLVASSSSPEPLLDALNRADKNPHIRFDADLGWDDEQEKFAIEEWQERCTRARSAAVEEAKADAGETEFELTNGMRAAWVVAQRADPELLPLRDAPDPLGYRLGVDGLLEKHVIPSGMNGRWVAVVPDGRASHHLSWKRWTFLQNHVGVWGAHRNDEKTLRLMTRIVYWKTMRKDITAWIAECLVCLRARSRPTK
jgi:hypothetical protein